jgi:hypothetical protein
MLIKVFSFPVIILYFIFVRAGIVVMFYLQLKLDVARLFSSYTVGTLQRPGWYSHKEINLQIIISWQ